MSSHPLKDIEMAVKMAQTASKQSPVYAGCLKCHSVFKIIENNNSNCTIRNMAYYYLTTCPKCLKEEKDANSNY